MVTLSPSDIRHDVIPSDPADRAHLDAEMEAYYLGQETADRTSRVLPIHKSDAFVNWQAGQEARLRLRRTPR